MYMTDADLLPLRARCRGARSGTCSCGKPGTLCARLLACNPTGAPRLVAANSSRLDRISGSGWVAVGDAAMAFDPLSSQGLKHALESGIRAGEAVNDLLAGAAETMRGYDARASTLFDDYLRLRARYYGREQRWPRSVFWRRRQAVAFTVHTERRTYGHAP